METILICDSNIISSLSDLKHSQGAQTHYTTNGTFYIKLLVLIQNKPVGTVRGLASPLYGPWTSPCNGRPSVKLPNFIGLAEAPESRNK